MELCIQETVSRILRLFPAPYINSSLFYSNMPEIADSGHTMRVSQRNTMRTKMQETLIESRAQYLTEMVMELEDDGS